MLIFVTMLLVFSKAVVEAVFTETPVLTMHRNWFGFSLGMVSIAYFTEIVICKLLPHQIVLPASLALKKLFERFEFRKLLFGCVLFLFAGLLVNIDYNFDKGKPVVRHMSATQYFVGSTMILFGAILLESVTMTIIAKVSAPTAAQGSLNASVIAGFWTIMGRFIGNVSVSISASVSGDEFLNLYLYSTYSILGVLMVIVCSALYRKMGLLAKAQQIIDEERRAGAHLHHKSRLLQGTKIENQIMALGKMSFDFLHQSKDPLVESSQGRHDNSALPRSFFRQMNEFSNQPLLPLAVPSMRNPLEVRQVGIQQE